MKKLWLWSLLALLAACVQNRTVKTPAETGNFTSTTYFALAEQCRLQGDVANARVLYERAWEADPLSNYLSGLVMTNRLAAAESSDDRKKVIETAEKLVDNGMESPQLYKVLAQAYAQENDYRQALKWQKKAYRISPDAPGAITIYQLQQGLKGGDPRYLEKALELVTAEQSSLYGMVAAMWLPDNPDKALTVIEEGLRRFPQDQDLLSGYISLLINRKDLPKLRSVLQERVYKGLDTDDRFVQLLLEMQVQDRDWAAVLKTAPRALDLDNPDTDQLLLYASSKAGADSLSIVCLERLLADSTMTAEDTDMHAAYLASLEYKHHNLLAAARSLAQVQRYTVVNSLLNDKLADSTATDSLYHWLELSRQQGLNPQYANLAQARVLLQQGRQDKAIPLLTQAVPDTASAGFLVSMWLDVPDEAKARAAYAVSGEKEDFLLFAGWYYQRRQKYDQAMEYANRAMTENPSPPAWLLAADTCEKQAKYAEALDILAQAVERYPDDASVLNARGYLLTLYSDQYDEACSLLTKAVQLNPTAAHIWDSLAWCHFRRGEYQQALDCMAVPLNNGVNDSTIAYHLGAIYAKLNYPEQARQWWQTALELDNEPADVQKAEQALKDNFKER